MRVDFLPPLMAALLAAVIVCMSPGAEAFQPSHSPLGSDISAFKASGRPIDKDTAAEQPVEEPTGVISLRQALSLALLENPSLRSFAWNIRAKEAHELQSGLLPNPNVSIQSENFGGSTPYGNFNAAETTLQLSQLIELGGKRAKRVSAASLDTKLANWNYEATRIAVLTEVTRSFINVLAAQEHVELAKKLENVAQRAALVASERAQAGKTASIDKTKADVELATSRIHSGKARRSLTAAKNRLAALWGGKRAVFEKAEGDFYDVKPAPSESEVIGFISRNPDIARWDAEMERLRAAESLEKAKGVPDVTIQGGARIFSETASNAFTVGLSVPLPIFDRNQGAYLEARFNLTKAAEERKAAKIRIRAALDEAYQALLSAYEEIVALEADVLPGADEVFAVTSEGYRQGKFAYLEVLDAQRVLFETEGRRIDALAAYHLARTEVEKLTGTPIDSIQSSPNNE